MGGSTHEQNISMLTPQQQQFFNSLINPQNQGLAQQNIQQGLQPYNPQDYQDVFQKAYVDPAMQTFNQQVLPAVQQRFVDANAGSSSALNQALAQSASDLTTALGSQYGNFYQNQQNRGNDILKMLMQMGGQQTFQPVVSQSGGILGPTIGAAGTVGAGAMMSSIVTKENVKDCEFGLSDVEKIDVKQFDYKTEFGGRKNCIGLIAEDAPEIVQTIVQHPGFKKDYNAVDLGGLIGLLINSVKELSSRIKQLES